MIPDNLLCLKIAQRTSMDPHYDTERIGEFKADVDDSREAVVETIEHHVSYAVQNGVRASRVQCRPSLWDAYLQPGRSPQDYSFYNSIAFQFWKQNRFRPATASHALIADCPEAIGSLKTFQENVPWLAAAWFAQKWVDCSFEIGTKTPLGG